MKVIKEVSALQEISDYHRTLRKKIGLVPTMGFLHEGHVSLILNARNECDIVIVSVFVNPTQFSPDDDFKEYPRDFLRDYHICKTSGTDYIFNPDEDEMYKENYFTYVNVKELSNKLEGKYRPEHFTYVTTIVLKLINITKPHNIYFGQKDAQQAVIIDRMIKDLDVDTDIKVCKTIREEDGLAKSSRNIYLSEEERKEAAILNKVLNEGKIIILEGRVERSDELIKTLEEKIKEESPSCRLQYLAITDNTLLDDIENLNEYKGEVLISLSAFYGKTRLIDNIIFLK
ncbi:MAG: pantoate--beta-alanine ligase [Bacteroidetes bacterium]|nr:pantoate--beta-alanine ligase [Bacteroidota bacterium]